MFFRDVRQFSEGVAEAWAWAGAQGSFDMVRVFSGVIEDLTDRTKQCSTDDKSFAHLVELV